MGLLAVSWKYSVDKMDNKVYICTVHLTICNGANGKIIFTSALFIVLGQAHYLTTTTTSNYLFLLNCFFFFFYLDERLYGVKE